MRLLIRGIYAVMTWALLIFCFWMLFQFTQLRWSVEHTQKQCKLDEIATIQALQEFRNEQDDYDKLRFELEEVRDYVGLNDKVLDVDFNTGEPTGIYYEYESPVILIEKTCLKYDYFFGKEECIKWSE